MKYKNLAWRIIKKNLLASKFDTIASFVLLYLIAIIFNQLFNWLVFIADWSVVTKNLSIIAFGSYPEKEIWRPTIWFGLLTIIMIFSFVIPRNNYSNKLLPLGWLLILPIGIFMLAGGLFLTPIPTRYWGGLALTLILTVSSAAIALPIGILLAIGRQSKLKMVNRLCKLYIDIMRSVPLIAVLFFGQLLIPLFLPIDIGINRVVRAILAFALFVSAYVAEDVRGGLQSISRSQIEASEALGLSQRQTFQLILLPQAIRISIPALTNQAVGLLQNTSLMAILGLVELLGITRSLLANPDFMGYYLEIYIFIALVYWLSCTSIALLSRSLEKRLNPITTSKAE